MSENKTDQDKLTTCLTDHNLDYGGFGYFSYTEDDDEKEIKHLKTSSEPKKSSGS